MSRYPKTLFGPAGVCDACGRFCCTLCQAGGPGEPGIRCYHCHQGHFRHRSEWAFSNCPECGGGGCRACNFTGIAATRREL